MKRDVMTGKMMKNADVGANGYSKKSWKHYLALKREMLKQDLFLSVPTYRILMGYPVAPKPGIKPQKLSTRLINRAGKLIQEMN